VGRKCAPGARAYFQNERFAWEVSEKRCPRLAEVASRCLSVQNVRFASAGAPFCGETLTFAPENCNSDPGQKRWFRVRGVHISHFHVILLISFSIFLEHFKHEMLIFS
jgi:hypothetical protein